MVMNLADVCHHLTNTAKDILKLPEFQKVQWWLVPGVPTFYGCCSDNSILVPLNYQKGYQLLLSLNTQCNQAS